MQPRRRQRREAGRLVRDRQRPGGHVEAHRTGFRLALDGAHRRACRHRRGRGRPALGARQRAVSLELDAPRRPSGRSLVRRALDEDDLDRAPRSRRRTRTRRSSVRRTGAGARISFPAPTAARREPIAPRTAAMDFLPWYLEQAKAWETAHGVRILDYLDVHYYPQASGVALTNDESVGDVGPAPADAQEPLRPDVPRRVVDRHGRRPGGVSDPADEGLDRGPLPGHEARDQRVQLGLGRRDQRRPRAGRGARDLRTRGRGPRHAVGRARRLLEDRGRLPPLPQLRRGGSAGER